MTGKIFIVPGLNNSGPGHWQTEWENAFAFTRILQKEWDRPDCDDWIGQINEVLAGIPDRDILLAGHSLGCCTIAHWAARFERRIKGALLVAPSDVDAASYPPGTTGFSPMPLQAIHFPTVVIASSNDYYVSVPRAEYFARSWGSHFVNTGAHGHINASSDLGGWPEGLAWLEKLDRGEITMHGGRKS